MVKFTMLQRNTPRACPWPWRDPCEFNCTYRLSEQLLGLNMCARDILSRFSVLYGSSVLQLNLRITGYYLKVNVVQTFILYALGHIVIFIARDIIPTSSRIK